MEEKGVVYLLCGAKCAERLVVSIYSLRKVWDGPVTVGVTDDQCEEVGNWCREPLGIDVKRVDKLAISRHGHYCTKTLVPTWTPYERTVYIDADTLVVGKFDELFEPRLVITWFADWVSTGRRMGGRIKRWEGISPQIDVLVARQLSKEYPAINTGVFGFHRQNHELNQWHVLTMAGSHLTMTDELSMQILHPELDCHVVDDRYNCSPLYAAHGDDVRIWHLHGRKHIKHHAMRELWAPVFDEVRAKKVARIQRWGGAYDKWVKHHLRTDAIARTA